MIEIRIHGRGGQGNVVAAYLLAGAAIEDGRFGQAFPSFGAERRGAPVTAFVRIAATPVQRHSEVREPAFLLIQDRGLLHVPGVLDGLRPGGGILVNTSRPAAELGAPAGHSLVTVPAGQLGEKFLGRPLPNTALLAAFLALTALLPLEALVKALAGRFRGELLKRNTELVKQAASTVPAGLWQEAAHASGA
jgi:pyruvate ferredoxin oxidoreductase gamma subunit